MTGPKVLNPHPPEFERFLYAPVGEDRQGYVVTVLSTLARLGLDPWNETAELAMLGRDAARLRLGKLLSRVRDVPALASDHGKVARELSLLLPDSPPRRSLKQAGATSATGRPVFTGAVWAILAIALVLLQMLFVGGSGSGSGE
ncbi:hypothetical protein DDZ14_18900 [Maritimibacter sp. 55A14]|uniref:hypothetical protein n=1 Tax=Maritimibacter sp. 55A14 TaxID=2174844 RepID=UPI000D61A9A3|nr:hypothetical protein [Maritimibacter sp. 55A14]PWE28412.1 hypothetical protein DDZ14_18900 [Maritimibacter sp. 55A14]